MRLNGFIKQVIALAEGDRLNSASHVFLHGLSPPSLSMQSCLVKNLWKIGRPYTIVLLARDSGGFRGEGV